MGVGGRGEGIEGEEMVRGRGQRKRLSCEGELRNGRTWVSLAGAASLRALGFAGRSSEWQRTEFEWLKVGGKPSSPGTSTKNDCISMLCGIEW